MQVKRLTAVLAAAGALTLSLGLPVAEAAPAKVNLYLHVTGRRADGYHELTSLFVRTALGDRLVLETAGADSLTLTGPFAAALADGSCDERERRQVAWCFPYICG